MARRNPGLAFDGKAGDYRQPDAIDPSPVRSRAPNNGVEQLVSSPGSFKHQEPMVEFPVMIRAKSNEIFRGVDLCDGCFGREIRDTTLVGDLGMHSIATYVALQLFAGCRENQVGMSSNCAPCRLPVSPVGEKLALGTLAEQLPPASDEQQAFSAEATFNDSSRGRSFELNPPFAGFAGTCNVYPRGTSACAITNSIFSRACVAAIEFYAGLVELLARHGKDWTAAVAAKVWVF